MGVPPWAISPPSLMTPRCNTERQLPRCASQRSLQWARLEIPSALRRAFSPSHIWVCLKMGISWISLKWIKFASWMGKLDEHGKKPSTLGVWGFIWLCRYLISKTSFDVLLSKAVAMVSSNLPMLLIAVPGRHTCLQTHPFSLDLGSLKHSTSQTNRTVTYPKSCCNTKCYKYISLVITPYNINHYKLLLYLLFGSLK